MKEAFEDLVFDVLFPNQDIIFQFLNEIDSPVKTGKGMAPEGLVSGKLVVMISVRAN